MLQGKKVTVIGSGISGIAAAGLLKRHSAIVTLYDGNAQADVQEIEKKIGGGCKVVCGEWTKELAAETLLEAKGFKDSVVSIQDDTVDVIIGMQEINDTQRAQIEEIVTRKTDTEVSNIDITKLSE